MYKWALEWWQQVHTHTHTHIDGSRKQYAPSPLNYPTIIVPQARATTPSNKTQVDAAYLQPRLVLGSEAIQLAALPSCCMPLELRELLPLHTPHTQHSTTHIVVVIILWSFPFCGQLQLGFNLYFFVVVVRSYFIVYQPYQLQQQQQD